jgi:hypothetical protein
MVAKNPRFIPDDDGSVSARVQIPPIIFDAIDRYALDNGLSSAAAIRLFFRELGGLIRNGTTTGWGPGWIEAFTTARTKQRHEEIDTRCSEIDFSKLHASARTKSGFVGVYLNGKGFRAMGRDPRTRQERYLGSFDSAPEAAWARYLHYQEHKLPYGPLEEAITEARVRDGIKGTDEEIGAFLLEEAGRHGTLHKLVPPGAPDPRQEPEGMNFERTKRDVEAYNRNLADRQGMQLVTCTQCKDSNFYSYQLEDGVCLICRDENETEASRLEATKRLALGDGT